MAFLRLAENPRDLMAGTRVLMLLPGVGPKKARALMDRLAARGRWRRSSRRPPRPGPAEAPHSGRCARLAPPAAASPPGPAARPVPGGRSAWEGLVALMTGIGSREPGDLASQIKRIRLFYTPLLERLYDNARARLLDLEQLEGLAARFPDRARFLAEIALDPPSYTEDLAGPPLLDEDFLILSTMHSAKGLEWDVVFVIHAADGNIPSDMATGAPGGDRGGAAAVLRGAHPGEGLALRLLSPALLHLPAHLQRRARLRAAHPLPARGGAPPVRRGPGLRAAPPTVAIRAFARSPGTRQSVTTEDIRRRLKGLFYGAASCRLRQDGGREPA